MKFKKTMRERYPRKTKKVILKYVTRSGYYEVVHFAERFAASQAAFYKRLYSKTPYDEIKSIIAELKESAKNQPKNMTKEEEIAYIIGDTDVSESLIESVNRCISCEALCECSLGAFPANGDDEACKYYSHE